MRISSNLETKIKEKKKSNLEALNKGPTQDLYLMLFFYIRYIYNKILSFSNGKVT